MDDIARSIAFGAAGVWAALALAMLIAALTRDRRLAPAAAPALFALAAQALHVAEEFATGFHHRFFPMLGFAPWPDALFVAFNALWIAAWALAIAGALTGRALYPARALLWFLGLAAAGNGLAHPALAVAAGGYFPGLATALPLGIAGIVLLRRLAGLPRA